MAEIDDLSYWDFIEITKYQEHSNKKKSGETVYKELKPSQKQMIQDRKEREKKKKGKK